MSQLSAILIGANSGLSHALALELAKDNVRLGLMAADIEALAPLAEQLGPQTELVAIDITNPDASRAAFDALWEKLDGAALVVINTAASGLDLQLPWQLDKTIVDINVTGFTALANAAFNKMVAQKYGQLAALTSIAGERGGPQVAFHASKSYQQNYLQGLRLHAQRLKLPVTITDLRMGYLDKMQGRGSKHWSASLPKIAGQCVRAMKKAKHTVYVTRRWRVISWLTAMLPEFIYNKRKYKG
ncbi:SDR family NAD(P)-dependent oxidoreductase [Ferrimonas balearica]|uniref:SDR family NAD(P)-dependent oxidoreductase n=1 Tax=Ferrimonas balearica TaxID=44012 RepID=UPI001C9925E0|nr:SDR family NAD(P)-dependent oxidoreductase [Ferrimonas balearica]MBY5921324.1 SDR family NAD(P)-dependent oxidoreductase [Ferrimonas balearica]MBY5995991.1 SDR family NAD(P)-dependent oxidoreductase [Ferrimonas balearica]